MNTLLSIMRNAAVVRHRWINLTFEGGDPELWKNHEVIIALIYGQEDKIRLDLDPF